MAGDAGWCASHCGFVQFKGRCACLDLRGVVVPSISNHAKPSLAHGITSSLCHRTELCPVVAGVRYLMGDDEVVLGVYGHLHVVAHHARASAARRHRARIRVGQRELTVRLRLEFFLDLLEATHLPSQLHDLLLQPGCLGFQLRRLCAVNPAIQTE